MTNLAKLTAALMVGAMMLGPALAYDFMQKRDCSLETPKGAPVHTTCLVKGGMQGGTIDLSLSTPDGKSYSLEGPIDGEDGHVFLLQKARPPRPSTRPRKKPATQEMTAN